MIDMQLESKRFEETKFVFLQLSGTFFEKEKSQCLILQKVFKENWISTTHRHIFDENSEDCCVFQVVVFPFCVVLYFYL